ncbi:unnamed protein product [Cochlearia groenlandica]
MEMEKKSNTVSNFNAKWDACIDLSVRRVVYSSLGGAFAGLLFFRSPVTRWASIAFGAGIGIGSAYTDCCRVFDASSSSSSTTSVNTGAIVSQVKTGESFRSGLLIHPVLQQKSKDKTMRKLA